MTESASVRSDALPATVRRFLAAHAARDADAALRAFSPDAVVVDDGTTYRGVDEIRRFVTKAGAGFTYTSTLVAVERLDATHVDAVHRLDGDFPGGVAVLHYRFTTHEDLVTGLRIEP